MSKKTKLILSLYTSPPSLVADDNEVLVLDNRNGAVERFDLAGLKEALDRGDSPSSSLDAGTMVVSLFSLRSPDQDFFSLADIAFVRSTGQILVVDKLTDGGLQTSRIYSCPFGGNEDGSSCEVWFREDSESGIFMDAASIEVDEEKHLVYVGFYTSGRVAVFTYAGKTPIGMVGEKPADSPLIRSIARRPGVFAPLSSIIPPTTLITRAGEPLRLRLVLRDDQNNNISPLDADPSRISAYAEGEVIVNNELRSLTFEQQVIVGDSR